MTRPLALPTRLALALALLAALAPAGCAASRGGRRGRAQQPAVQVNPPAFVAAVAQAAARRRRAAPPAVVVTTNAPPARGFAVRSLPDGQRLWESSAAIDARPWIAGDLVISHVAGEAVAWDVRTGRERWRHPDYGHPLVGASGDGEHVAMVFGTGGLEHRDGVAVVADHATGATLFEDTASTRSIGVPTVAAGYAIFPWDGQHLSIVDAANGWEVARIDELEDFASRALREGDALYFGGAMLYRFDEGAATGRRAGASTFALPRDDLPGRPHVLPSGYYAPYAGINARERTGVVARPDPTQPGVRLLDDTFYFVYHRLLFALDAQTGAVRWGRVHNANVAGAVPVRGALLVGDERGALVWLDARAGHVSGRVQGAAASGAGIAQAVFQAPLVLPAPAGSAEPVRPAVEGLAAAAAVNDEQLAPARLLAVRALATQRGAEATRALLAVTANPRASEEIRTAAGEALAQRTDGTRAMLDALGAHYDYYTRTPAPPVGFLARALANARDRRAVAPLITHLQDPYTPAADLAPLITALRELGDAAALPALRDFLIVYHAGEGAVPPASGQGPAVDDLSPADRDAMRAALAAAAEAVLALGGPAERRWLASLRDERVTVPAVREGIVRALAPRPAQPAAAPQQAVAAAAAQQQPQQQPAQPRAEDLPARATVAMIEQAFAPVRARHRQCVTRGARPAPQGAQAVTIQFRYDGSGAVLDAVIRPPTMQNCLEAVVRAVRLPRTQVFREVRTYTLPAR